MGTLRVVKQHIEHVAVGPIRYRLAARVFDRGMLRIYSIECLSCSFFIYKDDLLGVANGGKESSDRVAWDRAGKEEPIDGTIKRKLSGGSRTDEHNEIRIAPNLAYD